MSKLGTLIAIPIALFGLKRLQETIKDETTTTPLIPPQPKDTSFYQDLIFRQKQIVDKPIVIEPIIPTGPIKQPSAEIPKFVPFDILGTGFQPKGWLPTGPLPTKFDFDIFGFKDR